MGEHLLKLSLYDIPNILEDRMLALHFVRKLFAEPGEVNLAQVHAKSLGVILARFLGARAEDLVFVPNATSGLNAVIRSLRLEPDDEVLTTGHEYGAITRTWEFVGANLVVCEPGDLAERIGPKTLPGECAMGVPVAAMRFVPRSASRAA